MQESLAPQENPLIRESSYLSCPVIRVSSWTPTFSFPPSLQPAPVPTQPASALLTAASSRKASIFALFGGQGTNEVYFDELQNLYEIYTPLSRRSCKRSPRTSLFPLLKRKTTSLSILTALMEFLGCLVLYLALRSLRQDSP